jgi:hypothetical protein
MAQDYPPDLDEQDLVEKLRTLVMRDRQKAMTCGLPYFLSMKGPATR